MRIGIDARMYNESGVGRYISNLINQLTLLDRKNEYLIFLLKKDYDTLVYHNNFTKVLVSVKWYSLNEQLKLPQILGTLNLDLIHFPHFNVPILYRGKFVVTIHDLIHQHFQMRLATTLNPITYKLKQFAYKKVFKNAIFKSQKILVPSNYVKDLLINKWGVETGKIIVTYEAVDDKLVSIGSSLSQEKYKKTLEKFKIKQPFIFYVGNAHPHKNVEGLIEAFLELRGNYQSLQLVLSGHDHYFWQRIKTKYNQKDIIFTGRITDEELVVLYENAQAFVMPSFEEGFGIPILEAMAIGCSVVSSNAGSLPEVGGDAAIYFDPLNIDDMVEKIFQVLNSEKLRMELISNGLKRYKQFSWNKLARQTLRVYEETL